MRLNLRVHPIQRFEEKRNNQGDTHPAKSCLQLKIDHGIPTCKTLVLFRISSFPDIYLELNDVAQSMTNRIFESAIVKHL